MANLDIIRGRQVVEPLTNRSGGQVIAGDVVIIDSANDASFTTTTQFARASNTFVGVVQETIANSSNGRVLIGGYAPLVNVPSAVTRGMYAYTHTVAKQAVGSNALLPGAFAVFLSSSATPDAHVFGHPTLPVLNVTETDNSPTVFGVHKLIVTNGTLTDNGGGTVTLTTGGGSGGTTLVGVRVRRTAAQTISNATTTAINFTTEDFDTDAQHDNATNNTRLTVAADKGGYYHIGGSVQWAGSATGKRLLVIRKNGSTFHAANEIVPSGTGIDGDTQGIQTVLSLVATDYVELMVHQTSGGNLNTNQNDEGTQFWMYRVGT